MGVSYICVYMLCAYLSFSIWMDDIVYVWVSAPKIIGLKAVSFVLDLYMSENISLVFWRQLHHKRSACRVTQPGVKQDLCPSICSPFSILCGISFQSIHCSNEFAFESYQNLCKYKQSRAYTSIRNTNRETHGCTYECTAQTTRHAHACLWAQSGSLLEASMSVSW